MSTHRPISRRAELGSKILVVALVAIFLFGMCGFALAVLDAQGEEPTQPPPPSLPAIRGRRARPTATRRRRRRRVLLALAEPWRSVSPLPSPSPASIGCPAGPSRLARASRPALATESLMPVVPVTRLLVKREGIESRDIVRGSRVAAPSVASSDSSWSEASPMHWPTSLAIEIHPDVSLGDGARWPPRSARVPWACSPATHVRPSRCASSSSTVGRWSATTASATSPTGPWP